MFGCWPRVETTSPGFSAIHRHDRRMIFAKSDGFAVSTALPAGASAAISYTKVAQSAAHRGELANRFATSTVTAVAGNSSQRHELRASANGTSPSLSAAPLIRPHQKETLCQSKNSFVPSLSSGPNVPIIRRVADHRSITRETKKTGAQLVLARYGLRVGTELGGRRA